MPTPDEYRMIAVKSWREATADVVAPGRPFMLLLVMDARRQGWTDLFDWSAALLLQRCKALTVWGPDCNAVEGAFDYAIVSEEGWEDRPLIPTDSLPDAPLDEAIWRFLMPSSASIEIPTKLAIVEDREDWVERVSAAFADPGEFCSRHTERDP